MNFNEVFGTNLPYDYIKSDKKNKASHSSDSIIFEIYS